MKLDSISNTGLVRCSCHLAEWNLIEIPEEKKVDDKNRGFTRCAIKNGLQHCKNLSIRNFCSRAKFHNSLPIGRIELVVIIIKPSFPDTIRANPFCNQKRKLSFCHHQYNLWNGLNRKQSDLMKYIGYTRLEMKRHDKVMKC